jgi:hypothetical protein
MAIEWNKVERCLDKKEAYLNKAFELMGLISAASFATTLSMSEHASGVFSTVTLVAAVVNVCAVVTRFLLGAKLWGKTGAMYLNDPESWEMLTVPGSRFVFHVAIISFVVTCVSFIIVLA